MRPSARSILTSVRYVFAAPLILAASLFFFGPDPLSAQTTDTLEGRLIVIWGDPQPGRFGGGVIFELHRDDGTSIPLQVAPEQRNEAIGAFGKRVTVRGRSVRRESGAPAFAPESIEIIERENRSTVQPGAVTQRRMLSILVRYSGDTQTPHAPIFSRHLPIPRSRIPGSASRRPSTASSTRRRGASWSGWATWPAWAGSIRPYG